MKEEDGTVGNRRCVNLVSVEAIDLKCSAKGKCRSVSLVVENLIVSRGSGRVC